jgi:DNA-binding transcriptional MocR family regulator
MKLYEQLVGELTHLIHTGVLRPGERMPSVRELKRSHSISPSTVLQAYGVLEDQRLIEARTRSGYYVATRALGRLPAPETHRTHGRSTPVDVSDLVFRVLAAAKDRDVVPFGSAFPSPELFPFKQLSQAFGAAARFPDPWKSVTDLSPGNRALRRLIARRYLEAGCSVEPDKIVITCGAMEALNLCLQCVTRPGDLVAIEAPAFYAALQVIEALGLRAVAIDTHPATGVDLAALSEALEREPIKACWFMTSFQNPLGSLMPEEQKRALVELLTRHDVPLIEDDVYAELYFRGERPKPAKAFDRAGLVMHCSSFSKCLAPGLRVGWVAPGRYSQRIEQRQFTSTLGTSIPAQMAVAEYLEHGGYERHLRRLRQSLNVQQAHMLEKIRELFPAGSRVTCPDGGYFLWLELPAEIDALEVYGQAMSAGVSVSPGPMFSAVRGFSSCLRLNYGHPWTPQLDAGMRTLARIVSQVGAKHEPTTEARIGARRPSEESIP